MFLWPLLSALLFHGQPDSTRTQRLPDSIKSPEVVQDIAAFNMEVKAIKDASTQRVTVMDEKEKAHAEHDKVREIDADHQAALIENKISSSKKKIRRIKGKNKGISSYRC